MIIVEDHAAFILKKKKVFLQFRDNSNCTISGIT